MVPRSSAGNLLRTWPVEKVRPELADFLQIAWVEYNPGMNPIENPYAPGTGGPLRELAGRDEFRELARVAIERI
ncbi:MAG: hypothetical protein KGO22_14065 [Gammaproteobacteria bacterium]|nr:hypothetical protein [Gammaproteobacteria bacterium]